VTTPHNKVTNRKIKVGDRVSILFDGIDWYDGTISLIDRGIQTVKYDNRNVDRHRLLPKGKNKTWKLL
jgi:hypothetical protein